MPTEMGQPARINPFDPDAVARMSAARAAGGSSRILGDVHFTTRTLLSILCRTLSAATGWDFTKDEALLFGRRTAALMRAFNIRCGITPDLERPSKRYGSVPVDGPAQGQDIGAHWEHLLDVWYDMVGYDRQTGKPPPGHAGRPGSVAYRCRPLGCPGGHPCRHLMSPGMPLPLTPASWRSRSSPGSPNSSTATAAPARFSTCPCERTTRFARSCAASAAVFLNSTKPCGTATGGLAEHIEVLINDAVLDLTHNLDSPICRSDRIALIGQYLGG